MDRVELARLLLEKGMLKFGDFLLTSGYKSTVYVDLRPLPSFPREFRALAEELSRRIGKGGLCGVAIGGLPLATAVAMITSRPLIYVRKERKEHGTKGRLEGMISERTYVVVDDVATTGSSLLRAIKAVREGGAEVEEAWVVIDRLQGAREALEREGVELKSLATLPDVVKPILDYLTKEERAYAESYLEEVVY